MIANPRLPAGPLGLTRAATFGALLLFALLLSAEVARALGYTDSTPRVIRAAFLVFIVLAACAAVIEHFIAATRELRSLNAELEHRIAEKSEAIKASYANVEEMRREWALVTERQRILADMHDGLGASLIGLLRHVQSGTADFASMEQRVREAIQEMRIAVDALQPGGGDFATLLGNLRYRLDDMIRGAGIRMVWKVEDLPRIGVLQPSKVFALQRVLLEAVTNALKHAQARHLTISAKVTEAGRVEIGIRDDGRGFDASRAMAGMGLASMRSRAQCLGARLEILSERDNGTEIRLSMDPSQALTSHDRGRALQPCRRENVVV